MEFGVSDFIKNKKIVFFLTLSTSFYACWFTLYTFFIEEKTLLDEKIISNLIFLSSNLLKSIGFNVFYSTKDLDFQMVGVDGSHPVWIGAPCNGLTLIILFSIFILAFPGSFKNKIWFIPSGIVFLHLINVLRITALAIINYYTPQYLDFNHNYTFTLIVYSCVFFLWIIWVKKFSSIRKTHEANQE